MLECTQAYRSFFFRRSRAPNSAVSGGVPLKFELIQALMVVLVTCKNEEDPIKMKALECEQDFPDYKSMGIVSNAQGQLTPQSGVQSGRNLNLSKMLRVSSLPARIKKIKSKTKALECKQEYILIFQTLTGT